METFKKRIQQYQTKKEIERNLDNLIKLAKYNEAVRRSGLSRDVYPYGMDSEWTLV